MRLLDLIGRLLYTPPAFCMECSGGMWNVLRRSPVCPSCDRILRDSRQRTSNRVREDGAHVIPMRRAAR